MKIVKRKLTLKCDSDNDNDKIPNSNSKQMENQGIRGSVAACVKLIKGREPGADSRLPKIVS